jgi:hypothetical protein
MAKRKYKMENVSLEMITQLTEEQRPAWENFIDERAQAEIYKIDKSLIDLDPSKLWAEFNYRFYCSDISGYVTVKRVGFVQGIYFSTGKIRVSCPLGGNYDTNDFKILNPENLSVVLDNL